MWILLILYTIVYNIVLACQGDYYGTSTTYNDVCFKRHLFAFAPLIISVLWFLGIVFFSELRFDKVAKFVFLLIGSGVSTCINGLHAHHKNINTGYQMNMTDTERFKKEESGEVYTKAAMAAGTLYSIHNIKNGIENIADVEHWKEMK